MLFLFLLATVSVKLLYFRPIIWVVGTQSLIVIAGIATARITLITLS